jgi:hypothetical protein
MTEEPSVTEDPRIHIDPIVAHLAEKFPEAGVDHVSEVVWEVYHQLRAEAKVPDHLPALTQHHAHERLHAESTQH